MIQQPKTLFHLVWSRLSQEAARDRALRQMLLDDCFLGCKFLEKMFASHGITGDSAEEILPKLTPEKASDISAELQACRNITHRAARLLSWSVQDDEAEPKTVYQFVLSDIEKFFRKVYDVDDANVANCWDSIIAPEVSHCDECLRQVAGKFNRQDAWTAIMNCYLGQSRSETPKEWEYFFLEAWRRFDPSTSREEYPVPMPSINEIPKYHPAYRNYLVKHEYSIWTIGHNESASGRTEYEIQFGNVPVLTDGGKAIRVEHERLAKALVIEKSFNDLSSSLLPIVGSSLIEQVAFYLDFDSAEEEFFLKSLPGVLLKDKQLSQGSQRVVQKLGSIEHPFNEIWRILEEQKISRISSKFNRKEYASREASYHLAKSCGKNAPSSEDIENHFFKILDSENEIIEVSEPYADLVEYYVKQWSALSKSQKSCLAGMARENPFLLAGLFLVTNKISPSEFALACYPESLVLPFAGITLLELENMARKILQFIDYCEDTGKEILSRIQQGESASLEFKSTFRIDLKTGASDKNIELQSLKSVAGFLNANGGTLLIGVTDSGEILGIEADKFKNNDSFIRHVQQQIEAIFNLDVIRYIRYDLIRIQGRTILQIECRKSDEPVILRGKNSEEEFYVRTGPKTQKLKMSEMATYIKKHFDPEKL